MTKTFETDLILTKNTIFTESIIVKGNITGKNGIRFNLKVLGNINARDINAGDINAGDINAWNINAGDINAWNINAGDIGAWNINAWNIKAGDINAWDIIIEKRIKKSKKAKTISRVFIIEKSKLERKEQ